MTLIDAATKAGSCTERILPWILAQNILQQRYAASETGVGTLIDKWTYLEILLSALMLTFTLIIVIQFPPILPTLFLRLVRADIYTLYWNMDYFILDEDIPSWLASGKICAVGNMLRQMSDRFGIRDVDVRYCDSTVDYGRVIGLGHLRAENLYIRGNEPL